MSRILSFFLFLLLPLFAVAQVCPEGQVRQYKVSSQGDWAWHSTPLAACSEAAAKYSTSSSTQTTTVVVTDSWETGCSLKATDVALDPQGNPVGTTYRNWGISLANKCVVPEPEPTLCAADAGTSSVMNFTVGWARSGNPDADDHVGKVVFPNQGRGAACVGGCSWEFTDNGVAAYRSAEPFPASGLHRLSVDFTMRGAGTACAESPEDAAASPNAPEPPCPGFVGEVNGVTKCVGTASQPVPSPDGPTAGRQAGGSEDNGNPAAGKKPDSGEGSGSGGPGRTPTSGSGGNAGGPAGAAGGTRPDGTTTKPVEGKEQAACGAPGQPKCRIDESGTPSGNGVFDAANRGADETRDGWLAEIAKAKELNSDGWTWTFQLPSGCTPLELPGYEMTLDVCRFQPVIHDIMSMVWLICTVMGCVWMVFNAQKN